MRRVHADPLGGTCRKRATGGRRISRHQKNLYAATVTIFACRRSSRVVERLRALLPVWHTWRDWSLIDQSTPSDDLAPIIRDATRRLRNVPPPSFTGMLVL